MKPRPKGPLLAMHTICLTFDLLIFIWLVYYFMYWRDLLGGHRLLLQNWGIPIYWYWRRVLLTCFFFFFFEKRFVCAGAAFRKLKSTSLFLQVDIICITKQSKFQFKLAFNTLRFRSEKTRLYLIVVHTL